LIAIMSFITSLVFSILRHRAAIIIIKTHHHVMNNENSYRQIHFCGHVMLTIIIIFSYLFFYYALPWCYRHCNNINDNRKPGDSSGTRQIRNTPDWSENAVSGDHLWVPTSVSGDCCYIGDNDCTVSNSHFMSWTCVMRGNLFIDMEIIS
jgi:hypothetical protein